MASVSVLRDKLSNGYYDKALTTLYGGGRLDFARDRYIKTADEFIALFGDLRDAVIVSTPGRTEICGNHTDHNNGLVAAAAVTLDIIGIAAPNTQRCIKVKSSGYKMDVVDLARLDPVDAEVGHSVSLVRGVVSYFAQKGVEPRGFSACTNSEVLKGSGLSSSAAYEVEIASFINLLFCGAEFDPLTVAAAGQYAENVFYGKPCGLLDETACAVGGFVCLDFEHNDAPLVRSLPLSLSDMGARLCVVDTGGSHSDLTDEYAAIPREMKAVAGYFGKSVLREVSEENIWRSAALLRAQFGDRAFLRAAHYWAENRRVNMLYACVKERDYTAFHNIVRASGLSSFMFNQNAYAPCSVSEQGLTLGYALCGRVLGEQGSYRLQGGGFAGTMQAFVPTEKLDDFVSESEAVFGSGSCHVLDIRNCGTVCLDSLV